MGDSTGSWRARGRRAAPPHDALRALVAEHDAACAAADAELRARLRDR